MTKRKTGDIVSCKVIKIIPSGAIVSIGYEETAFLHISEITKGYVDKIEDVLKVGDKKYVEIIEIKGNKNFVSMKNLTKEMVSDEQKRKNFEDKIQRFLKESNENQRSIQKSQERKRGGIKKVKKLKK